MKKSCILYSKFYCFFPPAFFGLEKEEDGKFPYLPSPRLMVFTPEIHTLKFFIILWTTISVVFMMYWRAQKL